MDPRSAQLYADDSVYLGVWTNWSRGRIRGATLTMSRRNGGLLTAFLALFVTVVGTRFWRIGCFFVHRYFASEQARDALCHQRQAILRNAADSTSGLWDLLNACWAWRRHGLAPYRRLLPSVLFAILTVMAFAVATIFSSEITTSVGHEVLLKDSSCGYIREDMRNNETAAAVIVPYVSQRTALSVAYAQRCYNNNSNFRDCSVFYKPRLQWTADRNSICPFPGGEDICLTNFNNLHLDSGYIDSDRDLGINSSPGMSFLYRSVADCAPLKTKGYSKITTNVPSVKTFMEQHIEQKVMQYFYGKTRANSNFTSQFPADEIGIFSGLCGIAESANPDYSLRAIGSLSDVDGTLLKEKSDFAPIPALEANATDVTLFFLSTNGVAFTKPCDDSWYHAHTQKTASLIGSGEPATFYVGEEPARVLGCATRYQFCNPDPKIGRSCTPLTGIFTATAAAGALWQTKKQQDFFNTISTSILTGAGGLYDIVVTTGISSLIARHGLAVGVQGLLPSNQWQLEVENWFGVTLADLQRVTVELVTGPADPAIFRFLERPQTDEERLVCRSLKIRSDAVTSFSVLGLGILLGLGGLIIIVSITAVPLADWMDKRFKKDDYKRFEWAINDTLQLQRLAHEELGCGTWIGGNDFPTTAQGEKLAIVDVSDPSHPKLVNPTAMTLMHDRKNDVDDVNVENGMHSAHITYDTNSANDASNAQDASIANDATDAYEANGVNGANTANDASEANEANEAHETHEIHQTNEANGVNDANDANGALSHKSSNTTVVDR